MSDVRFSFRIRFDYQKPCLPAASNLRSAEDHPVVIDEYLKAKCVAGRVLGLINPHDFPQVQVSPFGVVPKGRSSNWHLIVDLLSTHSDSTNEGIPESWYSLSYSSVQDATQAIRRFRHGSFIAKVDIKSAYRNVPIYPDDWWLLGMKLGQAIFIDTVLPFGLRSAPKTFTALGLWRMPLSGW